MCLTALDAPKHEQRVVMQIPAGGGGGGEYLKSLVNTAKLAGEPD